MIEKRWAVVDRRNNLDDYGDEILGIYLTKESATESAKEIANEWAGSYKGLNPEVNVSNGICNIIQANIHCPGTIYRFHYKVLVVKPFFYEVAS